MFTGIVECTGIVRSLSADSAGGRLELSGTPDGFAAGLAAGESVAVNGCCLTVTADSTAEIVRFDLLQETLRVTNLGDLRPGDPVNLERAMRADARFSGHFVQGHVDATGEILSYTPEGRDHRLVIALPAAGRSLVIPKGSITVDGMSLTIAGLQEDRFTIWITPHTHAVTSLTRARPGRRVNLEFDLIGKYIARALDERGGALPEFLCKDAAPAPNEGTTT